MMHHWSIALRDPLAGEGEHHLVIAVPDDIPPEDLLEDLEEAELEVNWMIKMSPVLPSSSPN